MKLVPIQKGMRLFCRRVVNLGNRRLQPGQEFVSSPKGTGALSWRRICQLYEQRRLISESDPYFDELMRGPGMEINPEFAEEWLGQDEQVIQVPVEPTPVKETAPELPPAAPTPPVAPSPVEIVPTGGGWYDVHVKGEKINEKGLRKVEAETLAEQQDG